MTEERVPYATDEVTQLRRQVVQLVDRLDAAFKTIDGFTDASNFQWSEYQRRIAELEATVQRLEQDNRRLRHLDAMPVDAIDYALQWCNQTGLDEAVVNEIADFIAGKPTEKHIKLSAIPVDALRRQYSMQDMAVHDYGLDAVAVHEWLATLDGDA